MPSSIKPGDTLTFVVSEQDQALRLDQFLTRQIPEFSRSYFQKMIDAGHVTVNGKKVAKASIELKEHDQVTVTFPVPVTKDIRLEAQQLPVELVYEHPDFLIVNKPAGLIVHAPAHESNELTLVDWLVHKFAEIAEVGSLERPGIVHRLDMNTSGLLIIPRTLSAHMQFGQMFKDRQIHKTYLALVEGHPEPEGTIDFAIMRHPIHRSKMTHVPKSRFQNYSTVGSRHAITHYKVLEYFNDAALVEVKPITGRTHQIRVHFAAIGHPLLGDTTYGKESPVIKRHALHATGLDFDYQGQHYSFKQELPQDFIQAITTLSLR